MSPAMRFMVLATLVAEGAAFAETDFSLYTGTSSTRDSDLHVRQAGTATDVTLGDVAWDAKPFRPAPYYGLRLTHFFERHPNWGAALDFTHYKIYAKTGRLVDVVGTWQGASVATTAEMSRYVQRFEISHGVNLLSINALYRWRGSAGDRLQPYVGAGLGHYLLHAENVVADRSQETGYQSSGFGYQALGGIHYRLSEKFGAFVETKFDRGTAKVDVADGTAQTRLRSLHVVAGLTYRF